MDSDFSPAWIPPILAYCGSSILMTITNKFVLSGFRFQMPFFMLSIQSLFCVTLLYVAAYAGYAKHRPLNRQDAEKWLPVTILMVMMLYTGSKALQHLSIPIFTIFKNLSIILVAYGEVYQFGGKVTGIMLLSFGLIVLSSVISAIADSRDTIHQSPWAGYIWMCVNCFSSAAFVIVMRKTMKKMSLTHGYSAFRDFDTVYYNNVLTFPIFATMSILGADGSWAIFVDYYSVNFNEGMLLFLALIVSGCTAFSISYASSWCVRITNSTTYSMVGALNKLPIAIFGMIAFRDVSVNIGTVASIFVGFLSGIVYTFAKLKNDVDVQRRDSEDNMELPIISPVTRSNE